MGEQQDQTITVADLLAYCEAAAPVAQRGCEAFGAALGEAADQLVSLARGARVPSPNFDGEGGQAPSAT